MTSRGTSRTRLVFYSLFIRPSSARPHSAKAGRKSGRKAGPHILRILQNSSYITPPSGTFRGISPMTSRRASLPIRTVRHAGSQSCFTLFSAQYTWLSSVRQATSAKSCTGSTNQAVATAAGQACCTTVIGDRAGPRGHICCDKCGATYSHRGGKMRTEKKKKVWKTVDARGTTCVNGFPYYSSGWPGRPRLSRLPGDGTLAGILGLGRAISAI